MRNSTISLVLGGALVVAAACGPPTTPPASPAPSAADLERAARADSVRRYYNQADVAFMTGMVHHHAQALVMARMAPTHGASPEVETLAARIINSQKDEIALMQRWLRDRGEPVPEVDDEGRVHPAAGAGHTGHHPAAAGHAIMAGMLTPDQMRRLDAARGDEWERFFLTYMIQHHQGAVDMVRELFATHGAGQGDEIFKIASDIGADQAAEIDRMQRMLQERVFGPGG